MYFISFFILCFKLFLTVFHYFFIHFYFLFIFFSLFLILFIFPTFLTYSCIFFLCFFNDLNFLYNVKFIFLFQFYLNLFTWLFYSFTWLFYSFTHFFFLFFKSLPLLLILFEYILLTWLEAWMSPLRGFPGWSSGAIFTPVLPVALRFSEATVLLLIHHQESQSSR